MPTLERPKYNDEEIPDRIRVDRIFSAAANPVEEQKIAVFAEMVRAGWPSPGASNARWHFLFQFPVILYSYTCLIVTK
jgi:hypothetical protein